jgi:ABC-type phosphate transport system substrate-binding protein
VTELLQSIGRQVNYSAKNVEPVVAREPAKKGVCMRGILCAVIFALTMTTSVAAQEITGSGSTFCFSLMAEWAQVYEQRGGAHIVYQPLGSALGITEIRNQVVDFAVSEAHWTMRNCCATDWPSFLW